VVQHGMKCRIFVNQSTIAYRVLCLFNHGNLVMNSIEMLVYGLKTMERGVRIPAECSQEVLLH
jgi:hypothetical protein